MKASTILQNKYARGALCAVFWLAVWQTVSLFTPKMLFASPWRTLSALATMGTQGEFWLSVARTLGLTTLGFVLAFGLGSLCGALCYKSPLLMMLTDPAVQVMKSVPVACVVAVALIWMRSTYISVLVSFFVVFPVSFVSMHAGLCGMSRQLGEMTRVFRVPFWRRARLVVLPQVLPNVLAGCRMSVGMCWKASIAGEIIGLPVRTVGEKLYLAKLYLAVDELFAWTLVIILVSLLFEKLLVRGLLLVQHRMEVRHGNPV